VLLLMRLAPPSLSSSVSSSLAACSSSGEGGWSGPALLGVVHILRNVAGNSAEVLANTSEALAACGRQIWAGLDHIALDAGTSSRHSGAGPRRRAAAAALVATEEENSRGSSSSFAAAPSQRPARGPEASSSDSTPRLTGSIATSPASVSHAATGAIERAPSVDQGNPQESDECECTSGAEVAYPSLEAPTPKQATVERDEDVEVEGSRQRSQSPDSSAVSSATDSPDPRKRCAEILSLFSLTLQALYQTDEALRQPEVFASEDAVPGSSSP